MKNKILAANLSGLQPNVNPKDKPLVLLIMILVVAAALILGLTSSKQIIGVYNCRSYTNVETVIAEVKSSGYSSEKASVIDETIIPGVYLVTVYQSPIEKILGTYRVDFQEPSEEFEELIKEVFRGEHTSGSNFILFKKPA